MKSSFFLTGFILSIGLFYGCKKPDTSPAPPPDPCKGVTITPVANKTHTITGQLLGTITITSPIGSGYQYSIGGTFQTSPNFSGLAAGNYSVKVKNVDSCTGTLTVTINGYGANFYNVRTLVNGYCGPCHLNGTSNGGKNFDADLDIVNSWDRIKARAVDGTPTFMPQGGQLTVPDKQKIVDWVNAGHRITD